MNEPVASIKQHCFGCCPDTGAVITCTRCHAFSHHQHDAAVTLALAGRFNGNGADLDLVAVVAASHILQTQRADDNAIPQQDQCGVIIAILDRVIPIICAKGFLGVVVPQGTLTD